MSLPSINFLHLIVSQIQTGQTFPTDNMGENNTPTPSKIPLEILVPPLSGEIFFNTMRYRRSECLRFMRYSPDNTRSLQEGQRSNQDTPCCCTTTPDMGENNTPTALKGLGVTTVILDPSFIRFPSVQIPHCDC